MSTAASLPLDALTGAYSRAVLDAHLPEMVQHAELTQASFALFVIDVDHFKTINDAYGHSRGDEVLRDIASRMRSAIRSSDSVFRYGGDEFVVVLHGADRALAEHFAGNILESIRAKPSPGDPEVRLSLSIGVAIFPEYGRSAEALFRCADRRSFLAKRGGRCRYVADDASRLASLVPSAPIGRLLEREAALEIARQVLASMGSERVAVIRVAGPGGSGRTRFLRELAALAGLKNYSVVSVDGSSSSDGEVPQPSVEAARSAQRRRALVGEKLREALAVPGLSGVLVTVDDLPGLDFGTFERLRQLLAAAHDRPVLIAYGTESSNARSLTHPAVRLQASVELKPLSPTGVRLWLRSSLRWEPPDSFVTWIGEQTAGLPAKLQAGVLFLIERGLLRRFGGEAWTLDPAYPSLPLGRRLGTVRRLDLSRLPADTTAFIGREQEVDLVNELIDSGRLLTLKGPGGVGKTRLALEVAAMRTADFAHGACFVELASATNQGSLVSAIAAAVGVRERPGRSMLQAVRDYLGMKDLLLVLDNFEQVVDCAPVVSDLLRSAPKLRVLVTSRSPLRITDERVFEVPPLALPLVVDEVRAAQALASPAVALFVERAQARCLGFELNDALAAGVVELCNRLDGLPLAIQIVAARADELSVGDMLSGRHDILRLAGPRDKSSRHQTLQDVLEWSYALLAPSEQQLFAELALFRDGCTATAVEAIGSWRGPVTGALLALSEKSLLQAVPGPPEPRFLALATVRQYAHERLLERGAAHPLRRRFCAYFASLARRGELGLRESEQRGWLLRLDADRQNLEQALEWCVAEEDWEVGFSLCAALGPYWEARGSWSLGRRWCEQLIPHAERVASPLMHRLLLWGGRLSGLQGDRTTAAPLLARAGAESECVGDRRGLAMALFMQGWLEQHLGSRYAAGRQLIERSLPLFEELGDHTYRAAALLELGHIAIELGDYGEAQELCERGLKLSRDIGYAAGVAESLYQLARVERARGRFGEAMRLLDEQRSIGEAMDDKRGLARATLYAAELARSQRDYDRASQLYEQNIAICRQLGDNYGLARSLKDVGEIARHRGELERAAALYEESTFLLRNTEDVAEMTWVLRAQAEVELARSGWTQAASLLEQAIGLKHDNLVFMMLALSSLAAARGQLGDLEGAARLMGASDNLLEGVGEIVALDDKAQHAERVAAIRARMPDCAFERAHAEGRSLDLEAAADYALERRSVCRSSIPEGSVPHSR